jgi:hypothetical protein
MGRGSFLRTGCGPPPGRRQRDRRAGVLIKVGSLLDEGMREAARGSVRFEEDWGKDDPYWHGLSLRRFGKRGGRRSDNTGLAECCRGAQSALGLVPRQTGTGGRVRLLGISKRGDTYLRTLLIHGARTVMTHSRTPTGVGASSDGSTAEEHCDPGICGHHA